MKRNLFIPAIASCLLTLTLPANAIETRCGWLANTTPGNWFLKDSEGTWIISQQMGYQAQGMDNMPSIQGVEFVKTNRNYGYVCACLDVSIDSSQMRINSIQGGEALPLSTCQQDPSLPAW